MFWVGQFIVILLQFSSCGISNNYILSINMLDNTVFLFIICICMVILKVLPYCICIWNRMFNFLPVPVNGALPNLSCTCILYFLGLFQLFFIASHTKSSEKGVQHVNSVPTLKESRLVMLLSRRMLSACIAGLRFYSASYYNVASGH